MYITLLWNIGKQQQQHAAGKLWKNKSPFEGWNHLKIFSPFIIVAKLFFNCKILYLVNESLDRLSEVRQLPNDILSIKTLTSDILSKLYPVPIAAVLAWNYIHCLHVGCKPNSSWSNRYVIYRQILLFTITPSSPIDTWIYRFVPLFTKDNCTYRFVPLFPIDWYLCFPKITEHIDWFPCFP